MLSKDSGILILILTFGVTHYDRGVHYSHDLCFESLFPQVQADKAQILCMTHRSTKNWVNDACLSLCEMSIH